MTDDKGLIKKLKLENKRLKREIIKLNKVVSDALTYIEKISEN